MKKEVALAIIIGFAIGLVITYGIYTAQKALQSHTVTDSSSKPTTDQTPEQDRTLHIVSPENETVASEKSTTLAGTTSPNSYVVILTTDQEYLTQADENGNFAKEITLEAGANYIIPICAYCNMMRDAIAADAPWVKPSDYYHSHMREIRDPALRVEFSHGMPKRRIRRSACSTS